MSVISEFDRTWMRAFAENLRDSYIAHMALSDARVNVARCRAALDVAKAELAAAEENERIQHGLGDVLNEQMARIEARHANSPDVPDPDTTTPQASPERSPS